MGQIGERWWMKLYGLLRSSPTPAQIFLAIFNIVEKFSGIFSLLTYYTLVLSLATVK